MSCSILASSSSAISNAYNNIINGIYSVEKVFEMMQYQPMIEERRGNMV